MKPWLQRRPACGLAALVLVVAACSSTNGASPGRDGGGEADGTGDDAGQPGPAAAPLGKTSILYAPEDIDNEELAYARMIRLEHAGDDNGTLLAVFEHDHADQTPSPILVRRSTDDGDTWEPLAEVYDGEEGPGRPGSYMYQTLIYELPQEVGGYPAGTLLLTANVIPTDASETHFQLWRSLDHGATWDYVTMYQAGGPGPRGILGATLLR